MPEQFSEADAEGIAATRNGCFPLKGCVGEVRLETWVANGL